MNDIFRYIFMIDPLLRKENTCIFNVDRKVKGRYVRKRLNSEKEINVPERRSLPSLKESLPGLKDIVGIFKRSEKKEKDNSGRTYLRAMPLHNLSELDDIKSEVNSGKVLILRITPLADENVDAVKRAVKELIQFVEAIGGDIARLGEERVVICPPDVKIWREENTMSNKPVPTPV